MSNASGGKVQGQASERASGRAKVLRGEVPGTSRLLTTTRGRVEAALGYGAGS